MADQVIVEVNEEVTEDDQKQLDADLKELGIEPEKSEPPAEDKKSEDDSHDDDDDDHDASSDVTDDDPEREAIRQRRREERKHRREVRKQKEESLTREVDFLRRQLAEVNEWKNSVNQNQVRGRISQVEHALRESQSTLNVAREAMKEAVQTQNGEAMVEAQELFNAAQSRISQLANVRQRMLQQASVPPQQNIDPNVVNNAQNWIKNKSWYDPNGTNEDSQIALTVDNMMAREGWNPATPEYWTELDARLQKFLPHRFTNAGASDYNGSNGSTRRVNPPTASSGQGKSGTSGEYRLSPERVKAMKEAGMWDDPEKRKRMIKRYMEQDRNKG